MSKVDRLRESGFVIKDLPKEYAAVLEEMDEDQIDLLMGMKKRLDAAQEKAGPEVPPYAVFMVPPF